MGGGVLGGPGKGVSWRSRRTISGGCRMWGTIPGGPGSPPIPNHQKSRGKPAAWWGGEAAKIAAPYALPPPHWWAGPGWRGDSSKALEAWVPASWGSPRPQQGWASLGAPFPPPVAVSVHVPLGIRELLATPTEILLLTAIARRGCLRSNQRVERQSPALRSYWARCPRSPLWCPFRPHFGSSVGGRFLGRGVGQ